MNLSNALLLKLAEKYPSSSMINLKFKGKDLSFKTDADGNPVVLFLGKLRSDGKIKGERYTRVMVRDDKGILIKDHWDLKGKV